MPRLSQPQENPNQFPLIIYDHNLVTNKVYSCDELVTPSPTVNTQYETIARGRGAVITGTNIEPNIIEFRGHITPRKAVLDSPEDNRKLQHWIKNTFAEESRLLYIYQNDFKFVLDLDDSFVLVGLGQLASITQNEALQPQVGSNSLVGVVNTTISGNTLGFAIAGNKTVDLTRETDVANQGDLWALGIWFFCDNPDIFKQLNQIQVLLGSDPTGSSNYIAFDTSVIPQPIIETYTFKEIRQGWNFLPLPFYFRTGGNLNPTYNPLFAEIGSPDYTQMGAFISLILTTPTGYTSTIDRVAIGGIITFSLIKARFWDVFPISKIDLDHQFQNNFVNTYTVNLVNKDTRQQALLTDTFESGTITEFPTTLDIMMDGIGEQFPIFSFEIPTQVTSLSVRKVGTPETISFVNSSFNNSQLILDSFNNKAFLNGFPALVDGILPTFFDGTSKVVIEGEATGNSTQTQNFYDGTDVGISTTLDFRAGLQNAGPLNGQYCWVDAIQEFIPSSNRNLESITYSIVNGSSTISGYLASASIYIDDGVGVADSPIATINNVGRINNLSSTQTLAPATRYDFIWQFSSPILLTSGQKYYAVFSFRPTSSGNFWLFKGGFRNSTPPVDRLFFQKRVFGTAVNGAFVETVDNKNDAEGQYFYKNVTPVFSMPYSITYNQNFL